LKRLMTIALVVGAVPVVAQESGAGDAVQLDTVTVIGTSPQDPSGVDLKRYAANAQTVRADELENSQALSLVEYLARRGGSVFLSDAANNPYQPDLFYRGYSISPLLGLPQGLALYVDGVRVNEVFGDVVNWDLIPEGTIATMDLIPGSNPVFGQNSLGGALSLKTRSGFDSPGTSLEVQGGSYGRVSASAQQGWASEHWGLFLSADADHEDGWRDHSDSRLRQFFAKGSYQDDVSTADLSVTVADNRLRGNGAVPIELMEAEGRSAVFTYPDQTEPKLFFVNLQGSHALSPTVQLSGGAHLRRNHVHTFNGDGTEYSACEDAENTDASGAPYLCEMEDDEEAVIENLDGEPVVASAANDTATINTSTTRQTSYGARAQVVIAEAGQPRNRVTLGFSSDFGDVSFGSETELAALRADRGASGSGEYDADSLVRLDADRDVLSAFSLINWAPLEPLDITAAGTFTYTDITLRDRGEDDSLSGDHSFKRFSPMIGATWQLPRQWAVFGSYAESTRAPTPVELTCANPDDPCRLPNGFVDDPPLDQVVTRTLETGLRHSGKRLQASAAAFWSVSKDDIIFITDGSLSNEGYFDNVGDTVRQGIELGGRWEFLPHWSAGLQYTWISAEFRESFLVNTPNHPLRDPNDEDEVAQAAREVHSGDRIPLIPRQLAKFNVDWRVPRGGLGLEIMGRSDAPYRGDEANVDDVRVPGYAVVNAYGDWAPVASWPALVLFARVTNLFDRDYATFGVYGEADEVLGDDYEDARRFVGPGAPREWLAGLRVHFD